MFNQDCDAPEVHPSTLPDVDIRSLVEAAQREGRLAGFPVVDFRWARSLPETNNDVQRGIYSVRRAANLLVPALCKDFERHRLNPVLPILGVSNLNGKDIIFWRWKGNSNTTRSTIAVLNGEVVRLVYEVAELPRDFRVKSAPDETWFHGRSLNGDPGSI